MTLDKKIFILYEESDNKELMEVFGWIGYKCSCGTMFKVPMDHGFGDHNDVIPSAIYSGDCPKCGKTFNTKVEVYNANP